MNSPRRRVAAQSLKTTPQLAFHQAANASTGPPSSISYSASPEIGQNERVISPLRGRVLFGKSHSEEIPLSGIRTKVDTMSSPPRLPSSRATATFPGALDSADGCLGAQGAVADPRLQVPPAPVGQSTFRPPGIPAEFT